MDEEERRGNVLHDIPEGKPDIGSLPAGAVVVVNVAVVAFYAYMADTVRVEIDSALTGDDVDALSGGSRRGGSEPFLDAHELDQLGS